MDAKLTLKLNKKIIERAKEYAVENDISLSRLVENYLQSLTGDNINEDHEISAFVKSLSTGSKIPADLDHKKEYSNHLENKYK